MNSIFLPFVAGAIVGFFMGILLTCLIVASKRKDHIFKIDGMKGKENLNTPEVTK